MGDHQVGQSVAGLEVLHQVEDLGLDGDVEGRDGLVGHDQLGIEGEGPGQADALALAAGELVGVAVDRGAAQPHLVEQRADLLLLVGAGRRPGCTFSGSRMMVPTRIRGSREA